jgi:alkylation response protein AidB-like acyl-CoA dehydrogenase
VVDLVESPEQVELRASLRRLFGGATACLARPALAVGYDLTLWRRLADEIDLLGLALPEQYGGSGFTRADRAAGLYEMGRTLFPSPFLSTAVLAAEALLASEDAEAMAEVLPRIAAGRTIVCLAYKPPAGTGSAPLRAVRHRSEWALTGERSFVLDGCQADLILVSAVTDDGTSLFLAAADAPGLTPRAMRTLDLSRPQAHIRFVGTPARIVGAPGTGLASIRRAVTHATVALAAEQVGGADRCLESAIAYAATRQQFGRAIGSFQAIKHKCADLLIQVESARSASRYAAALSSGQAQDDELEVAAALAGAYCSNAYFAVAAENVHIHGGIGFTWEHDAHLYFRRAKAAQILFGTAEQHRERLTRHLGLVSPAEAAIDVARFEMA